MSKETLRQLVEAADLGISSEQVEKLAPAVDWGRREMRKLKDVDLGDAGPAPVFLPAAPPAPSGDDA